MNSSVARAVRAELVRQRHSTRQITEPQDCSPLFNVACRRLSAAFSLLELAGMLSQLNKPGSRDARDAAEKGYCEAVLYLRQLPDHERSSLLLRLESFRAALDEFRLPLACD
jgi:hypothetical protein